MSRSTLRSPTSFILPVPPLRPMSAHKKKPVSKKIVARSRWKLYSAPFTCLFFSHWKVTVMSLGRGGYINKISPQLTQSHLMGYLCRAVKHSWAKSLWLQWLTVNLMESELCEKYGRDVWLDKVALFRFTGGWEPFVCLLVVMCGCVWLSVYLCYLCDSTAESFGQLSNLFLCRLHLLSLLIQLLCLPVVIYLQVLHTNTHTHTYTYTYTYTHIHY